MTADTRKGPATPLAEPRRSVETADLVRVTPDPRNHEGPATRRVRDLAAQGLHPFDVARASLDACSDLELAARLLVVRDLAIAVRRERGQGRRKAQRKVDAWLAGVDLEQLDVDVLIGMCAEDLARRWAPRARWTLPALGQHLVVIELGAAS